MRDFTLVKYEAYLNLIKKNELPFYLYSEFITLRIKPEKFSLIRHDVDRKPGNALKMAILEHEMGIKSTYYFRIKPYVFDREIIKKIENLGHEIGYHYESLSDENGDMEKAISNFQKNLNKFRSIVNVSTCCMHGRPLKKFDNRDIWRIKENHDRLIREFNIIGEVYLDIDYSEIAYINDTGRNWSSSKSNVRDKVFSNIDADFASSQELSQFLKDKNNNKIVFQIHPERWSDNILEWTIQLLKDKMINFIKRILR